MAVDTKTLEQTYSGQWSSDPARLKNLLDAGETIVVIGEMGWGRAYFFDNYNWHEIDGIMYALGNDLSGYQFIDPAPKPLEPRPSEWKQRAKPIHTNDPLYWIERKAWRIEVWEARRNERSFTHKVKLTCHRSEVDKQLGVFPADADPTEIKAWALQFCDNLIGMYANG